MMTYPENITDRKREKKIEVEERYSKKSTGILSSIVAGDEIKSTSELAENFNTKDLSSNGLIVKNSVGTVVFNLVIIHATQIYVPLIGHKEFRHSAIFFIFEIVFSLGAISGWSILLNRKTKLQIDSFSLNFVFDNIEIEWDDLIATHVRTSRSSKSTSDYLVINFYQPYSDSFIEKQVDLTYLDIGKWRLAAAIEYYKELHNQHLPAGKRETLL